MARVPRLSEQEIPDAFRASFKEFQAAFAQNGNLPPHYYHCPEMAEYIFGMGAAFRANDILPHRLVEVIVVTVSKLNECPYCTVHHSNRAVELGMAVDTLESILEPNPPGLDEKETLVRDYVRHVIERPWGIRESVYDAMAQHFSHRELVAITMRANLASMFNKINMALQIEMEEGALEGMLESGIGANHVPAPETDAAD